MSESDTPCILCAECEHNCYGKLKEKVKRLEADISQARQVAESLMLYIAMGDKFDKEMEDAWVKVVGLLEREGD